VPVKPQHDPQFLDEFHQKLSEDAAVYFEEDDEERSAFIDTIMERRGYQKTAAWAPPPPPGPGGQGAGGNGAPQKRPPAYFKR
jgi:hypothetical protein